MSKRTNMFLNEPDALSVVLHRLQLRAEVYVHADFCGAWAVNTSGSRRIPFHLVGGGEAWLHMQSSPVRHLSSGDLVLFPQDHAHVLSHSREAPPETLINAGVGDGNGAVTRLVCGFFEFGSRAAWPLLDSLPPVIVFDLGEMSAEPVARMLVDLMISELDRERPGFYAVINHLAHLIFVQIVRRQIEAAKVSTGLLAALFDGRIGRALGELHRKPEFRWTLESLAREARMSRSNFAREFHRLAGITPKQYVIEWRMQLARELLETTRIPVADIAARCGYESEPAFRKAFVKITGHTPGVARRSTRER
jgi:AraC family transcriptional activator of mtrCDE